MAGKRQHFIPRILLRGFISLENKRSSQVFVCHRERGFFWVPVEGIGVENYFYKSKDLDGNEFDVDDTITNYEQKARLIIERYRSPSQTQIVEGKEAAELAVHFAIRTSHVRRAFASTTEEIAHDLEARLSNPDVARRYLKLNDPSPSKIIRDAIREGIRAEKLRRGVARIDQDAFERQALKMMRENFGSLWQQQTPMFAYLFEHIRTKSLSIAELGHNRALSKSITPEVRQLLLSEFSWRIDVAEDNTYMLSDCVAIATTKFGTKLPLFFTDNDDVVHVEVPISHDRTLIGSQKVRAPAYTPASAEEIAGCSWDFFISSKENLEKERLRKQIGRIITDHLADIRDQIRL